MSDYKFLITANCPITPSDYNFADQLEQNTAVYAPITFQGIVIVMIDFIIFTEKLRWPKGSQKGPP